jgi:hypothetical protein
MTTKDELENKCEGKVIIDLCEGHLEKLRKEDYTIVENPHKDWVPVCCVRHCGRTATTKILVSRRLANYLWDTYIQLDDDPEEIARKIKAAEKLRKTIEILATEREKPKRVIE